MTERDPDPSLTQPLAATSLATVDPHALAAQPPVDLRLHDPLTGLANWQLFSDRAAAALARAGRNGWSTALLVVDIDRFHEINDEFGHASGDLVLVEVAKRLDTSFRAYDSIARPGEGVGRLGGNEFIVVCDNVGDAVAAASLCQRIAVLLAQPVTVNAGDVLVTAAVGVAITRPDQVDIEELIAQAEAAMRHAKQRGRGAHVTFGEDLFDVDAAQGQAARDLQRGLDAGELRLHYQLKVALDSDRIVGVEGLLRWQHPDRGMVPPLEFIGLAERTGLIVPIGKWVIEEACRAESRWRQSFPDRPPLMVSVNISACQFGPELVEVVGAAMSASATGPTALCLEITESLLMENLEGSVIILRKLADLGVALSIDDFGTGFSSLARLKQFPLHELKIDKSFVDGLGIEPDDTAIVAAVIAMAHALKLSVVAEGVETAEQLQGLRTLGCDQAQGFFLARPGPEDTIDALLYAEAHGGWRYASDQAPTADAAPGKHRPERILVVDDAADVRQLAHISLSAVGFEVHEAVDGASALATAARVRPDCILLDLLLPDMSGIAVCRALRLQPDAAECTILILTSMADTADKVEAFSAGADDYMVKPFSPRDLAGRVRAAIRRRHEDAAPVIEAGTVP
jgi:diguanylate cyclase (GGDEF)-like protein